MKPNKIEKRADDLLAKLTLEEKISLLSGKDIWNTVPIPRLGIPSITMTDGPHGVRASNPEVGRKVGPATSFPTGISMSASWNPELVEKVGQALGEETRDMDCDILLGPCINIVRHPLGGRNFESYSEDPYLAGRTAVAYINGVQSRGVGTSLKHYAVNNYEIERHRASSNVDERTLREIYLAHFEMAVEEAQPWTVMCSYNRINGVYASQNGYLLKNILKHEWGFQGAVVSDWGANHTIFESVANGLDLEMPGPAKYYRMLGEAIHNWQVDQEAVDQAVRRVLRLVLLSGRMDGTTSKGSVNSPAHQALARTLAEEAITLLKNEGNVLPVSKKAKTIAVIGPNAAEAVIQGGGSANVEPPYRVTPLEGLKAALGSKVEILYEQGCDNYDEPRNVPAGWLKDPKGQPGLRSTFYTTSDLSGTPREVRDGRKAEFWWHIGVSSFAQTPFSGRWEGSLTVPAEGLYLFRIYHSGIVRLYLDGKLVVNSQAGKGGPGQRDDDVTARVTRLFKGGKTYALRLEYVRYPDQQVMHFSLGLGVTYAPGKDDRLARAAAAARRADIALVFVGYPEAYETEGTDRPDMSLTGKQDELVAAVAAANPKTAVVLNVGAPVGMPWLDRVAAVVQAYYPGQENGNAVARVLLGAVNPSGKLPVTFPKRLEDSPAFINHSYPGCREVNYGEGFFIGYRYFDKVEREPLFPFGFGLSYTSFKYNNLRVPKRVKTGKPVQLSVTITNTGEVAGKEVVQLYVADSEASLPRPPKELKGFAKVELKPGASQDVTFMLEARALSFYDPYRKVWTTEPGEFQVLVGSSSRDIRLKGRFTLE